MEWGRLAQRAKDDAAHSDSDFSDLSDAPDSTTAPTYGAAEAVCVAPVADPKLVDAADRKLKALYRLVCARIGTPLLVHLANRLHQGEPQVASFT